MEKSYANVPKKLIKLDLLKNIYVNILILLSWQYDFRKLLWNHKTLLKSLFLEYYYQNIKKPPLTIIKRG